MTSTRPPSSDRAPIAVALDTLDTETACRWAVAAAPYVSLLKIGLEFYLRNGADGVRRVREAADVRNAGCGLFLDLKLHDIPATVAGAARAVAELEPDYLTVHAAGGRDMVAAAADALPDTRITAVTVLTSLGTADLAELGLAASARSLAVRWAALAVSAGARAVVSSPDEVRALRAEVGPRIHMLTPGVRPEGAEPGDQKRVATPGEALAEGSDVLVIGRPITGAPDVAAAAAAISADLVVRCRRG